MAQDNTLERNELYSSMEVGKPYAAYIKTILGKVGVTVWDNFVNKPVDVILQGDPSKREEGCIVKVWSAREDVFFKRNNQKQIKSGNIISYQVPEENFAEQERTIEQSTDDELRAIVNYKYFALTNKLNTIKSVAVLFRMLNLAEEMDKSEKITKAIQARISELQVADYPKVLNVDPNN